MHKNSRDKGNYCIVLSRMFSPVHCCTSNDNAIHSDLNPHFCTRMKIRLSQGVYSYFWFHLDLSQPNLFFFSTTTLAIGGWLNSDLLFRSSWAGLEYILTASFACRVRASLNFEVMSILNLTFSFGWTFFTCLYNALFSFLFSRSLTCSLPLIRADLPDSPS